MTEFKVGDKLKVKEKMWTDLDHTRYGFNKDTYQIVSAVFESMYPSVSFVGSGYRYDAAYFELVEEEKVKSKFCVEDKVVSIKDTPQAPEGFIGYVTLILNGQYGIHVTKDGEYGAKAFDEDELELLSSVKLKRDYSTPQDIQGNIKEEAEYTGGSSSYYKVDVNNPTTSDAPYQAECNDVIEALGLTFTEGNIFKAIWRIAAARQGKKKKGNNSVYDAEKVVFFAERLLIQEKSKEGK